MTAAKSSKSSTKAQKDSSKTPTHPPYSSMVTQAVSALKGTHPKGVSRQAIAKYLQENFTLPGTFKTQLNKSLKSLVDSGKLVQVKASFKEPTGTKQKASDSSRVSKSRKPTPAKSTSAGKSNAKKEPAAQKKSEPKAKSTSSGRATKAATKSASSAPKASPSKGAASTKKSATKEKATRPTGGVTKRQQAATGKAKGGRSSTRKA